MARVYVRSITCSSMYKKLHFVNLKCCIENEFCSMWVQPYQNRLLSEKFNQQNKWSSCIFWIKYRYIAIFYWEKTQLSFINGCFDAITLVLCQHGFCEVSVTLYNVIITLSPALSNKILDVHPWSDSNEFPKIGQVVLVKEAGFWRKYFIGQTFALDSAVVNKHKLRPYSMYHHETITNQIK